MVETHKEKYDFEKCATRLNPEDPIVEQDLLAAIYVTYGDYTSMAMKLRRPRSEVVRMTQKTPHAYDLYCQMRESVVDQAEANIFDAVREGDKNTSMYILNTLGKNRGYSTRQEQKIEAEVTNKQVSDRELAKAVQRVLHKAKVIEHNP